jgi:hypothetical protein
MTRRPALFDRDDHRVRTGERLDARLREPSLRIQPWQSAPVKSKPPVVSISMFNIRNISASLARVFRDWFNLNV